MSAAAVEAGHSAEVAEAVADKNAVPVLLVILNTHTVIIFSALRRR